MPRARTGYIMAKILSDGSSIEEKDLMFRVKTELHRAVKNGWMIDTRIDENDERIHEVVRVMRGWIQSGIVKIYDDDDALRFRMNSSDLIRSIIDAFESNFPELKDLP